MFLKIFILFVLFTGIKGSDDYIFDDKADGWLKLYKIPSLWNEAKIRCEIEGAVLASPVVAKLRDAMFKFVNRQGGVVAIYTGIRTDFDKGDFLSIEGIPISSVPVQQFERSSIEYMNSESCIVWDLIGLPYLRRTKCEAKFPYVCYKKRTRSDLLEPVTESGLGAREPETNMDSRPLNRPSTGQLPPDQQLPPQDRQPSSNLNTPDTRPQSNRHNYSSQYPETNHFANSTQMTATNQQTYPIQNPQTQTFSSQPTNQVYQTQLLQSHQQNGPSKLPKCSFDRIENLVVINNKDVSTLMNYIAGKPSVTVLFADSVYMSQNGSMWQVDVENIGSSQPVNRQPPPVVHITPDIIEPYNQGNQQSAGSQRPYQVDPSVSQPTTPQGSNTYQGSFSQTPTQTYTGQGSEINYNTESYGYQPTGTNYQQNNFGSHYSGSQGTPQGVTSPRPTSPYDYQPDTPRVPAETGYSKLEKKAGGRFKLHQQLETFTAAATRCASEGAVVASPLTTDLKDALTNYVLRKTGEISFYTGIRANFSKGDYYSTEGVSLTKMPVSLNPGSPASYQGSDSCIIMSTNDNIVTSVKCTDRYPYVCFKQSKVVHSCGIQDTAYKYEQSTQRCYKFHNIAKTWPEAYKVCNDEGGYLVILNSKEESDALKIILSKYPTNKLKGQYKNAVFVGIRDWHDGNSWTTVKGESLQSVGYTGWAATMPLNISSRNCGTFARNGLLFNDPCILNLAFICEKDPELLYDDQDKS